MKGQIPAELRQFSRVVEEKTGRKIEVKVGKKDIERKFKELIKKEIEKRKLFEEGTILNIGQALEAKLAVADERPPLPE